MGWAFVENDSVTEFIANPKGVKVGDVNYPPNIFSVWSEVELNAIGWYTVAKVYHPDRNFYNKSAPVYTYNSSPDTVTMSFPNSTAIDFATAQTAMTRRRREGMQSRKSGEYDSYQIRKLVLTTNIPSGVVTKIGALRAKNSGYKASIANAATIADLEAINMDWNS